MKQLPTAEQFIKILAKDTKKEFNVINLMIEFAKIHALASLEAASEEGVVETINKYSPSEQHIINKESILNAYPLSNIK